jgi:hypothetical protein
MSDNPPAERNPNPLGETTSPSSLEPDQVIPFCQYSESSAQRDPKTEPKRQQVGLQRIIIRPEPSCRVRANT